MESNDSPTGLLVCKKASRTKRDAQAWVTSVEDEMRRGAFIRREPAERTTITDALGRGAFEKNVPDDLHESLRQLAKRSHRSVTKQVIKLIESGVSEQSDALNRPAPITVKGARAMTRDELDAALNDQTYRHYQSADELNAYLDDLRADRDDIPL